MTTTDQLTGQITKTTYTYGSVAADTPVYANQAYTNQIPVETSIVYQDGVGKTYKAVNKSWTTSHLMAGEQTILYDALGNPSVGNATKRCYDSNEQVTNIYEYGFQNEGANPGNPGCYSGSALNTSYIGPLRRQTTTAYHPYFSWNGTPTPPTYTGTHIVDAPDSVTVADGSNNTVKQALYSYDQSGLQPSGAINLSSVTGARANITTLQHLISSGTFATTDFAYYDTGQLYTMIDPCGNTSCADVTGTNHTTTYSYTDNYAGGTGTPPGQTFAYLTQVTHANTGVAHIDKYSWGYNDGLIRSHTDCQGNCSGNTTLTTSFAYNDPLLRLTNITNPDGGQTTVAYNDSAPSPTVTTTKMINTSQSVTSVAVRDGFGHTKQTQLTSDP